MAIRKIVSRSILDATIASGDLAAGSVNSNALDVTAVGGTGSALLSKGTTAQRPSSPVVGYIRYNTTTDCYEQYTSLGWAGIAAPPVITTISPTTFNGESGSTITINGANFQSGITATFINNAGTSYAAAVTTLVNSSQITATTPQDFTVADEPIDVKVTNANGLSTTLADALDCGGSPTWTTAAGSIGSFYDIQRTISTSVTATDPDAGATISYAIVSGALPTGLSFNTSTGAITGTASAVGSDTTSSFTVRATDNAGNTSTDRTFSMTIKAPVITSYTTVGSGTFSVPSGVTAVQVLVVAGGGGGGSNNSGGGGAGGMIEHPSFPVTPSGTVSYTLGGGGAGVANGTNTVAASGSDSVFGTLTAKGGGGSDYWTAARTANSGGSGAGGSGNPGYRSAGGTGTQPSQPGASGSYGYGYPGGLGGNASGDAGGGGGGGAGGAGVDNQAAGSPSPTYPGSGSAGGHGGLARASTITGSSVYYAGGGGGGSGGSGSGPYWPGAEPPGGVGGIGGPYTNPYSASPLGGGGKGGSSQGAINAIPGGTNTGGGGGGGDNTNGGNGGPGIIIVRY